MQAVRRHGLLTAVGIIVVGYDTYLQTEEVFEQHRPIVAGDELVIDVELTSVRRTAGRDFITVTNTFTDTKGERVHTLHTTVVGVTAEDIDGDVKTACQQACPAQAIRFGDLRDSNSAVAQAKQGSRNYALLGELNSKPRTTYLARLRNPHPDLAQPAGKGPEHA